jgi:hypothetical protein
MIACEVETLVFLRSKITYYFERNAISITIFIRIREAPGSIIGSDAGYVAKVFRRVSSVSSPTVADIILPLDHSRFLPNVLKSVIDLSTILSVLHSLDLLSLSSLQTIFDHFVIILTSEICK